MNSHDKKGLVIFLGESFRTGGQLTKIRGLPESRENQFLACQSHIRFIEHIKREHGMNLSVYIGTYSTPYTNDLLDIYKESLIGHRIYPELVGINNLFKDACKAIKNKNQYSFILYIRIDLYLKDMFFNVFNPRSNSIQFPCVCWYKHSMINLYPRVNDLIIQIPRKYYIYLRKLFISHDTWYIFAKSTTLTNKDFNVMINTYHDSDSAKDMNPLYYIVNRPKSTTFHSEGYTFDKTNFYLINKDLIIMLIIMLIIISIIILYLVYYVRYNNLYIFLILMITLLYILWFYRYTINRFCYNFIDWFIYG